MRYTTVIDIREIPEVYRNPNVRLLYLHLALLAGYHDQDKDLVRVSVRNLAASAGLTVSATRHAIAILVKWKLLRVKGSVYRVRKYIEEGTISPRAKTKKAAEQAAVAKIEAAAAAAREELNQQSKDDLEAIYKTGKTPFMAWYESKVKAAAAGDADALRIVEEKRAQYEQHRNQFNQQKQ